MSGGAEIEPVLPPPTTATSKLLRSLTVRKTKRPPPKKANNASQSVNCPEIKPIVKQPSEEPKPHSYSNYQLLPTEESSML